MARTMVTCTCEGCGEEFEAEARFATRPGRGRYCSRPCLYGSQGPAALADGRNAGERNGNWRGGVSKDNVRYKRRFRAKYPVKAAAHDATHEAIRAGLLVRQPCEVCGDPKTHAHHDDYAKPLEVRWLCRRDHQAWHAEHQAIGGEERAA